MGRVNISRANCVNNKMEENEEKLVCELTCGIVLVLKAITFYQMNLLLLTYATKIYHRKRRRVASNHAHVLHSREDLATIYSFTYRHVNAYKRIRADACKRFNYLIRFSTAALIRIRVNVALACLHKVKVPAVGRHQA